MKLTTWLGWIAMPVLLVAITSPRIANASPREDRPATQHFFCNTGYTLDTCREQIATLKTVVAKYPTEALGEWTWCWCARGLESTIPNAGPESR